jgi:hypothetical protein
MTLLSDHCIDEKSKFPPEGSGAMLKKKPRAEAIG